MTLDARWVGKTFEAPEREVTWRQTTACAAAVGDANPRYLDDTVAGGLVAPPMFAAALTWPLVASLGQRLEGFPREVLATMVHAGEHLWFHRPVRPGDRIGLRGRVVSLRPGRAGTRLVARLDAHAAGEHVFTEFTTALLRGVECPDGGASVEEEPVMAGIEAPGEGHWEAEIPVGREAPFVYDACTGIHFPIHTSVAFARAAGLPDLLLQGTCALALAVRQIVDREAGGDPGALRGVACRFTGMVVPPATLRACRTGRESHDGTTSLAFRVVDAAGAPVLDAGRAVVEPR